MKSLKKQLFAAIIMVVVAAVALTSSTFAWFAANTSVDAGTVSISATSDMPFLQISDASDGTFATHATLNTSAAAPLKLTTPLNLSGNLVSYKANQAAADGTAVADATAAASAAAVKFGTTYSTDPTAVQAANIPWLVAAAAQDEYVLTDHVYIRTSLNTSGINLVMDKPTVTATTNSIANSYRVLAVAADGKWMMYNKGTDTVTACTEGYLVASVAQETSCDDITIYVFFDGKDSASYSNNATDLSAIVSTLNFSCSVAP